MINLPIEPMLAELVAPPHLNENGEWEYPGLAHDPNMAFEFKWDGHRLIGYRSSMGGVVLYARSGRNVSTEYPEIVHALTGLPKGTVIDGEVVALVNGKSNLQALAGRSRQTQAWRDANMRFMTFDVLVADGVDVMRRPFVDRKALLEKIVGPTTSSDVLQVSKHITDIGIMWPIVAQYELEGVIAKPLDAPYRPGERGTWSKLKLLKRSNFTVAGYTQGSGSRSDTIGALVLAEEIPFSTELRFAGKCGTGFSGTEAAQLLAAMQQIVTAFPILSVAQAALAKASSPGNTITWLSKGLTVEIEYAERSNDEIVRFPSFKGVVRFPSFKGVVSFAPLPTALVKTGAPASPRTRSAVRAAALPAAPAAPTGVKVGYGNSGHVRRPMAGDVYQAPGSSKVYDLVVKGGDKGLYLVCPCPAGKFVWKGGSFSPCKHMKYVLQHELAGNTIVDGIFA